MLGPVDIEDWLSCEEDRLRAEIRQIPVVQRFNRQPKEVSREVGRDMARRLDEFYHRFDHTPVELDKLLADLRRAIAN
jgi:hypothetical protein